MKNKAKTILTLFVCIILLSGCNKLPPQLDGSGGIDIGLDVGPVEVTINIDNEGKISVTTGISRKLEFKLGNVGFSIGLSQTIDLSKHKPYHLFILWKDSDGNIYRNEYEIGKKFHVTFNRREWVREITAQNNSMIILVEKSFQKEETQNTRPFSGTETYPEPEPSIEENQGDEYEEIVECRHKAHEYDYVTCQHPEHPIGDIYSCTHRCVDYYGYPIPCHPKGDIFPCSHALHTYGDITSCIHLAHPYGDILKSD